MVVEIAEVGDVDLKGTGNFLGRIFGLVGVLAMGGTIWRGREMEGTSASVRIASIS